MKQRFIIFILLIYISLNTYSDDAYIYGQRVLELNNQISSFFPRDENSSGEKELFTYLEKTFNDLHISYSVMDYSELELGHSFSKGYSVLINGAKDDLMVIAVPLNNTPGNNSTRDGSINIAIALQLLEIFSKFEPPLSIEFLFLGAEKGPDSIYPIGSRYFLTNFSSTSATILLYLDMDSAGDLLTLKNSSHNDLTPMWMVEKFSELFQRENIDFTNDNIQALAFQSGFEKPSGIIKTYMDNEIPALVIESRIHNDQILGEDLWVNSFIESILSFILDNSSGFDKEWDRHYIITQVGNVIISVGESEGIFVMLSVLSILLLVILIKSRNLHLNLKRFRRHFLTFPLLLFLTFMYLFLSTLLIEELTFLKNFPTLWKSYPLLFLIFKISMTFFLYSSFNFLLRGLSISRSHHFYTYSAFVSVFISMFTVLIFNVNYSYFFLWSLLFISIFMITRNEIIKRLSILISPLPILFICYIILTHPYLKISNFLIMSRISGNIFLTIIIMPTLMLISSLNYFHHRNYRHRRNFRNILSIIFWGILTIFIFYKFSTSNPYHIFNKQPVYIDEHINLNDSSRSILIKSPAPIGDISMQLDEQKLQLKDVSRSAEVTAPMIENLIEIEEDYSTFLDRISLDYIIFAKGSPEYINIKLMSDKSLIIFDSTFPYELTSDGKEIVFFIGRNPKVPLEMKLILPRGSTPHINIQIQYEIFPYNFKLSGDNIYTVKKMTIEKKIEWNH